MITTGRTLVRAVLAILLVLRWATSVSATLSFSDPISLRDVAFQAPEWACLENVPHVVRGALFRAVVLLRAAPHFDAPFLDFNTIGVYFLVNLSSFRLLLLISCFLLGRLLCWFDFLSAASGQAENLLRGIEDSVIVIDNVHLLDGHLPPFFNHTKHEDRLMAWLAANGAKAVVVSQVNARRGGTAEVLFNNLSFCKSLPILVVEIGSLDTIELRKICQSRAANESVMAVVERGDTNEWNVLRKGAFIAAFRIVGASLAAICCAVSLTKLIAFWRVEGLRATTPQLILALHCLASLLRLAYLALDPIYAGLLFNGVAAHMMATITFPFYPISTLLLILTWKEAVDESLSRFAVFLPKLKIPFAILSVILMSAELIASSLRAARAVSIAGSTAVLSILYVAVLGLLTFCFFFMGVRVLLRLAALSVDDSSVAAKTYRGRLIRLAVLLVLNSLCSSLYIVGFIMASVEYFAYSPVGFHVCWSLAWSGLMLGTLTQCAVIRMPSFAMKTQSASTSSGSVSPEGEAAADTATLSSSNGKHRRRNSGSKTYISLDSTIKSTTTT